MKIADAPKWEQFDVPNGHLWWRSTLNVAPELLSGSSITDFVAAQRGNWAAIIQRGDHVWAITDGLRSFPILYTYIDGELILSSSPDELTQMMKKPMRNEEAAQEFLHTAFVLGTDTLIEDVQTVPAGTIAEFNSSKDVRFTAHASAFNHEQTQNDPDALMEEFYQTILELTSNFVDDARGHQILIPLSGGADSRLFMTALREVGADNVLAFTYGVKDSSEAEISRLVATGLGYEWKFVELDPAKVRQRWYSPETTSFLKDTWSGNALPHIQDWYALGELKNDPDVDPLGVVSPGHTVVGNEHDAWAYDPSLTLGYADMARVLAEHHFTLQGHPEFAATHSYSRDKISSFLQRYWPDADQLDKILVFIQFNLLERQAKYINNSVRAYEHFGFQWAMPMLETKAWDSWFTGTPKAWGDDREPYIRFTNERYEHVSGTSLPNFGGPAAQLDPTFKKTLKKALNLVGLSDVIEKAYAAHVTRHHPMAFEALTGNLTPRQLDWKLLKGRTILGIYSELFLDGTWTPEGAVLPPSK